ncbi:SDR family NAD(P)-dependent oxidoreductase [Pseudanabaena sp. FACHB-2040]|uniref:SDR family NAD(P)-dependent oxidoreductase n=1 Tax=Pseudanabaena sp. FACHB-2040 TaxID=2692859 RepID=UPI0016892A8F|nr:SDR family NAD(P)-dependent oxidoreductase [Pseudanabaena sp. FACHB-2040]MBD2259279.1 SDR family NAD(P)-dependent oxidoreductase [Pseudanabaena sp. FACHB-2040]
MNFEGKTALVTGASRGIGRAIAHELARQGVQKILLIARNPQRLADVVTEIEYLNAEAIALSLDLADPVSVNVAIANAWRQHGPIHLLVNCAGVAHQAPFLKTRLPHVQTEIATNLVGLYTITRLIARRMATRREGHIVNVSSLMGKVAAPTMATYSATKFAILGFTQALRGELAPYNVKVAALLPSLTDTDMVRDFQWFRWVKPATPEQVAQALIRGLHRGTPEILVDWQSQMALWCQRLSPWLLDRVVQQASPLPDRPLPLR